MDAGAKAKQKKKFNPISRAIRDVERTTIASVHVHVARMGSCTDPMREAKKLFSRFELDQTPSRAGILIYLHLPSKQFGVVAGEGLNQIMTPAYWREFQEIFTEDLRSTHWENATALAVRILGVTLTQRLPRSLQDAETA